MIPSLPKGSPDRLRLERLFRGDGGAAGGAPEARRLLGPFPARTGNSPPESSGTGFFTYGLAWGIRSGLLDRRSYEPAARRGWAALLRAIQPDGRLGWVQQVSDRPEQVAAEDTQYYGVGAFLLAAAAVADLDLKSSLDRNSRN